MSGSLRNTSLARFHCLNRGGEPDHIEERGGAADRYERIPEATLCQQLCCSVQRGLSQVRLTAAKPRVPVTASGSIQPYSVSWRSAPAPSRITELRRSSRKSNVRSIVERKASSLAK